MEARNKEFTFVSLRNHPELLDETANLLNTEWPTSLAARLHYLAKNKEDLPCSFILLQTDQPDHKRVIGHSRLNKVLGKPSAVLVTSVLIKKDKRGCGLGKKLMKLTETYASQLDCTAIYLSTTDKCEFYKHLGYQHCSQVSPVKASSTIFTSSQLAILQGQSGEQNSKVELEEKGNDGNDVCRTETFSRKNELPFGGDSKSIQETETVLQDCRINPNVLNKKIFCDNGTSSSSSSLQTRTVSPPPPPPPPPPPTPPIPPPLQQLPSQHCRTVLSVSFWMMKEMR